MLFIVDFILFIVDLCCLLLTFMLFIVDLCCLLLTFMLFIVDLLVVVFIPRCLQFDQKPSYQKVCA